MTKDTVVTFRAPEGISPNPLTDLLWQGARDLIAQAVEAELNAFLMAHADQTDGSGRRRLVRHGHLPEREVQTGIGSVADVHHHCQADDFGAGLEVAKGARFGHLGKLGKLGNQKAHLKKFTLATPLGNMYLFSSNRIVRSPVRGVQLPGFPSLVVRGLK